MQQLFHYKHTFLGLALIFCLFSTGSVLAQEFSSSSYRVLDPVQSAGGFATSSSFQLWSSLSETSQGTSSSASYQVRAGFLGFPYVTAPVLTGFPGDSQVGFTWTSSTGYLGWTVSSYSLGRSTISGGPYTYNNVGNVTAATTTSLTNGTPYYFVVVANDFFGNAIATSTQITATPVAPVLTFSISTSTIYFGSLSTGGTKYASSTNTLGASSEIEAHNVKVSSTAVNGYTLSVQGQTLTSTQNSTLQISPLLSNTAPVVGQEQFGIRATATGGIGTVFSPYAASGFAYTSTATTSSQLGGASTSDTATTTYSVRYMSNITATTSAGLYNANLVYVSTSNF